MSRTEAPRGINLRGETFERIEAMAERYRMTLGEAIAFTVECGIKTAEHTLLRREMHDKR